MFNSRMGRIETYKVVGSDTQDSEVFAISLVEDPANLTDFIYMNREGKSLIKLSTEGDKRIVCGVVLIPEQIIPRYNEKLNKEYNLVFDEKEIFNLLKNFQKNGHQNNSNMNHDDKQVIDGLTFFQSWIVMDSNNDTSSAYGFKNLEKGTWMAIAYVEDDATWEKIKNGEVKGFSIEAFIDMEKIEMGLHSNPSLTKEENDKKINEKNMMSNFINFFKSLTKLSTIDSSVGKLTCDAWEIGNLVYKEDGELLVDSTFDYEGKTYTTDAEGKISDIKDIVAAAEDVQTEPASGEVDAEIQTVIEDEAATIVEEIIAVVTDPTVVDWEAVAKELQAKIDELIAANVAMSAKVEELGKQPAVVTSLGAKEVKKVEMSKQEYSKLPTKTRIQNMLLSKGL